jgi:transposase
MYLRRCFRQKDGKRHAYWALVESYRTARGPRQRVVSYLGEMDANGRVGVRACAEAKHQYELFDGPEPEWVEVDVKRVSVERKCDFGGPWLGLELCRSLGLPEFLDTAIPTGREDIPWPMMALVLVLGRLCDPSSELHLAEHSFASGALGELLGIPAEKVNDDRLYRALDKLLPHKKALEKHLKEKLGTLFSLDYDLLLYDVTSTFFEGQAVANDLAQRGYSRDHRSDCKQVNLALVVSRCGIPLGYELFAGNTADVTTVEDMVEHVEELYGKANRIWVMDRGMTSQENVEFLRQEGRRYIIGTPKSMLKQFERELVEGDWKQVHEGLEVRLCPGPDGAEVFILCRSAQRSEKEHAMHERFENKIAAGLEKIAAACRKRKQKAGAVERHVGQLLGRNTRAAGLFEVCVAQKADGFVDLKWVRREAWRQWAQNSEGCYLLRSNVTDWTPEELWRAYIQLTEAEAAFRIHKSDLQLRPVWHQKRERVEAHILVCFLGYVLWKRLGQFCRQAGIGDEPRKVFDEISQIALVDVVLPTRGGVSIRKRCVAKPSDHQAILLQRLGLHLPASLRKFDL